MGVSSNLPTTSSSWCPHSRPSPGPFKPSPSLKISLYDSGGRWSLQGKGSSRASAFAGESHTTYLTAERSAPRPPLPPNPYTTGRLPRQRLRAWKHVLRLPLAVSGAGSTEPRGCKLGRNNYLCQSPFLSHRQTKGTPPCSPPGGEACGGNRETHHCDPGSSAEFPTLGSGGGGWAGAGGVEERPTERERQRFSERRRESEETSGGENS